MNLLTIFTVTYNRPLLLERLYNSIISSDLNKKLFEWVIIVNGRKENLQTIDKINIWQSNKYIKIRYYVIEINRGLTRALNFYNELKVSSKYVMRMDDDDVLNPIFPSSLIKLMSNNKYGENFGFILNMKDHNEKLIGTLLPKDSKPVTNFYLHYSYKVKGDKTRIYPNKTIRRFSYKIFTNEGFAPDSQIYYQMDSVLELIPINYSLIIREYLTDGITKNIGNILNSNAKSIINSYEELYRHSEAKIHHKIRILMGIVILIIKSNKYYLLNQVKPKIIAITFFVVLFPLYKIYRFMKNFRSSFKFF
jgi:hypothetical protein